LRGPTARTIYNVVPPPLPKMKHTEIAKAPLEPAEILSIRLELEKEKKGFNSNQKRFPTFLDDLKIRKLQTPGPGAHTMPDNFANIVLQADRKRKILRRVNSVDNNFGATFKNAKSKFN
jgi:hypothetical protein